MEEKPKHPDRVVGWPGTLDELVDAIFAMDYVQLASFTAKLAKRAKKESLDDAQRDSLTNPKEKRVKLSAALLETSHCFRSAHDNLMTAIIICKPFM